VLPSKETPPLGQLEDFANNAANPSRAQEQTLNLVTGRVLQIPADTLLCSLDHEVELVEL